MHEPVKIEVADKAAVTIEWDDGATSAISARDLRAACQCAGCRDKPAAVVALIDGDVPITIEGASLVGNYAVNFVFGPDHHGTGIFPYDALRELGGGSPEAG